MLKERAEMNTDTSIDIKALLSSYNLSSHAFEWLYSEIGTIEGILARYSANPESISIDPSVAPEVAEARTKLRANPEEILACIARSADLLVTYQEAYDVALVSIAKNLGVDITNVTAAELASVLESKTVATESARIQEHYKNNGKLAACMLGMGGTGKGTLISQSRFPRVVNHTSRPARPGEVEGKDYYYLTGVDETTDIEPIVGPVLADLIRPGRGRYMTSLKAVKSVFETSPVAFIEQSPDQVAEIKKSGETLFPEMLVEPVCILPPGRGILEIATRVVVRTYGDPTHKDTNFEDYRINDSYFESTMGKNQIQEVAATVTFIDSQTHSGVAYIVNDDLSRANHVLDELISPSQ